MQLSKILRSLGLGWTKTGTLESRSPLLRKFRYRGFSYYEDAPNHFYMRIGVKSFNASSHQAMQMIIDGFCAAPKIMNEECYPKWYVDEN